MPDDGPSLAEARDILVALNFDAERSNERSALVLRALAGLRVDDDWKSATDPRLRTVDIMDWIRQHYGRDYKPNTRETIRRFTLHQFVDAGLVEVNPDRPDRPVNSPRTCYQLTARALAVVSAYRTPHFRQLLDRYLADLPGLVDSYAASRRMRRIPVSLPGGVEITLSPGGQNQLIDKIIHDFCPRFTPGGNVLYVGDAGAKWHIHYPDIFEDLGVVLDGHGKMPDVVVFLPDRGWLVLIEATTSHGPIDAKRYGELKTLFTASSADLVYVTCFPTRAGMRPYLKDIAWETDVWCADSPDHMIHFSGDRFLGPYGPPTVV